MSAPSPKMSPAGCEHMNHGACNPALAIVISVHVRPGLAEVIAKLPPLGRVDVQRAEVIRCHPRALTRLIVRGRRAADRAAEQDHLVLLPDLPVGVGDDVARIGVHAQDAGHLGQHARFFQRLPDAALAGCLPELHPAHRDGPLPGVAPALEQDAASLVGSEHAAGRHQAVGPGCHRVIPVLSAPHCDLLRSERLLCYRTRNAAKRQRTESLRTRYGKPPYPLPPTADAMEPRPHKNTAVSIQMFRYVSATRKGHIGPENGRTLPKQLYAN